MTTDALTARPDPGPDLAWHAPQATGPLDATVEVPGSKSLMNRYLVLAALADSPSRLRGALLAAADYEGRPGVSWRLARFRDDHAHVPAGVAAHLPGHDD